MGPVGVQEMVVIFLVALVLFGPKKLPELGRTIGKALSEFRRAQSELKATLDHHMRELERENESLQTVTRSVNNEIQSHYEAANVEPYSSENPYSYEDYSAVSNPSTPGASESPSAEPAVHYESAQGVVPRTEQTGHTGTVTTESPKPPAGVPAAEPGASQA